MNTPISKTPGILSKSKLDRWAAELRMSAAIELVSAKSGLSDQDVIPSHFDLLGASLPLINPEEDLRFNSHVTTMALEWFVLKMTDPLSVLYLGSKVVEQTFYIIHTRSQPDLPLRNLSVAKQHGIFFTPREISSQMVSALDAHGQSTILLDPCAGAGALLGEAIIRWRTLPYTVFSGVELDGYIATCANKILKRVSKLVEFDGAVNVHAGDGLDALMSLQKSVADQSTDIIINPPYGRMRYTKDRATNEETRLSSRVLDLNSGGMDLAARTKLNNKNILDQFPELKLDGGIPELSKLFLYACALNAQNGSNVAFIGPDSWMSGRQTSTLRKKLIETKTISDIVHVKESLQAFSTVNQHTSIVSMRHSTSSSITISSIGEKTLTKIPYSELNKKELDFVGIPRLPPEELNLYQQLDQLTKIGELEWVKNARGEVDQTLQQNLFCSKKTAVPLVRGTHLQQFRYSNISTEDKPSYLDEELFGNFISGKPKLEDFLRERIVGRQCSYAQQKSRLIFSRVPPRHAVGNSCNYLVVDETSLNFSGSSVILGLLNSTVVDWFFRAANSNNHVGNYEIDNFPFPSNYTYFDSIAALVEKLEEVNLDGEERLAVRLRQLLDAFCCLAFEIDLETQMSFLFQARDKEYLTQVHNLATHIRRGVNIDLKASEGRHFNHGLPKLSALDMMVIQSVPEGGNWQDIPTSVPGERLVQIRKMTEERGVVRTTYYGRLRRDHPAYTINTYFNRPGNGTHIHPVHNRTLTCREAARLQSFPDDYIFTGSQAAIRNQIGNAVPPLLAQAVGSRLAKLVDGNTCVDMFCGAGGLSLGLESAGWHTICGVDNDLHALNTFALNRAASFEPAELTLDSTAALQRDLLNSDQRKDLLQQIKQALNGRALDLLIGGPPCQGFSHAGYRILTDERNDLASIFIEFAERLRPSLFVLENVEGLATMKKGQVLSDIVRTLEEIGYHVAVPVWKLFSEEFGVPQMRRRLFVVASLEMTSSLAPPSPTHKRCHGRREGRKESDNWLDANLAPYQTVQNALEGLSL